MPSLDSNENRTHSLISLSIQTWSLLPFEFNFNQFSSAYRSHKIGIGKTHFLNWFYLPKPGFWNLFEKISNNTTCTFQFLWSFQLQFILIFSEEIIQYSRTFVPQVQTSWKQAHAPLIVESFPKTPRSRTWSEASQFSGSHSYKTKQTTFLHR
jgi:hypothetical protein